jgi:ATP-dependent DNA helicase RecG
MSSGFIKVDLATLARRESEQVEWKENVADEEAVACTLVAFANDRANLGGGYVVCGVKETRDEHGFPKTEILGLSAADFKRIEKKVLAICRDHVTPSIAPLIEELPTDDPARRVLVFVMPQTGRAHQLRQSNGNTHYWVRVGSNTIQARNGVLLELLTLRGELAPWDRRPCAGSRTADIDLLALRDTLQRIGRLDIPGGVESLLTRDRTIHVLVPPLCAHEPLTDELRPRNFALLLFGREPQRFIPGAYTLFSIYPGTDRSEAHAERHELTGTLIDQARRLIELLDVQSYTAFDKTDQTRPNAVKYPKRALHEAAINALAHRSYEEVHPTRVTVFSDRIEIESPGPLPTGIDRSAWREGKAGAKWRNQALAWLLGRLQLAQGEGQGIPTILRTMHEEGCPPARFDADDSRVLCVLPAHPRHALARTHRAIEEALALGDGDAARAQLSRSSKPIHSMSGRCSCSPSCSGSSAIPPRCGTSSSSSTRASRRSRAGSCSPSPTRSRLATLAIPRSAACSSSPCPRRTSCATPGASRSSSSAWSTRRRPSSSSPISSPGTPSGARTLACCRSRATP